MYPVSTYVGRVKKPSKIENVGLEILEERFPFNSTLL